MLKKVDASNSALKMFKLLTYSLLMTSMPLALGEENDILMFAHKVESRVAIQGLIAADFSQAVDTCDTEKFISLFADDGSLYLLDQNVVPSEFRGANALKLALKEISQGACETEARQHVNVKHIITNSSFDISTSSAKSRSYWARIISNEKGEEIIEATGIYVDELILINNNWRFKSREIRHYDPPAFINANKA